jgi:hypothetical protein
VEEIPMGKEVLMGTFFLNEHPVIIMFDFRALHDFISSTCTERARLTLVVSGVPYVISTPEGWVDTNRIAQKELLELSGRVISINLILLSGHGVDVILGMRWMKLDKVVLDITVRVVHMYSPVHGKVTLHLLAVTHIKDRLHHVVERRLEDIPVVREFPDVTSWVDKIEDTTLGFARQRFYLPMFINVGLSGIVCIKEE